MCVNVIRTFVNKVVNIRKAKLFNNVVDISGKRRAEFKKI
jgi:hypothetical protein